MICKIMSKKKDPKVEKELKAEDTNQATTPELSDTEQLQEQLNQEKDKFL